jgi:CheY-like chemotaxis protein
MNLLQHHSRILIVDDDPDILRLLRSMLSAAGYDVVAGYGGDDALRKVKKQRFDLILTDLSMPKMSGVELIELLRSDPETADIPILAVTAYVWDQLGRNAADIGCNGFISKPFDSRDLLRQIAKYVNN